MCFGPYSNVNPTSQLNIQFRPAKLLWILIELVQQLSKGYVQPCNTVKYNLITFNKFCNYLNLSGFSSDTMTRFCLVTQDTYPFLESTRHGYSSSGVLLLSTRSSAEFCTFTSNSGRKYYEWSRFCIKWVSCFQKTYLQLP